MLIKVGDLVVCNCLGATSLMCKMDRPSPHAKFDTAADNARQRVGTLTAYLVV